MADTTQRHADARKYHHGDLRRALIDAALSLLTESQDWGFSLREVARRAGVSHNAPYNHFPEKRDLLGAVSAAGFQTLRGRMLDRLGEADPAADLRATTQAYLGFAAENPALYRLMFGSALVDGGRTRPLDALEAGKATKAVLDQIIERGATAGRFAVDPADPDALRLAALACWSGIHGLTMLLLDSKVVDPPPVPLLVDALVTRMLEGLTPRGG